MSLATIFLLWRKEVKENCLCAISSFADLENSMKEILNTDMTDLINSPYTDSSRAPVLPAGAILLSEMIGFFELNSFFVSIFGIRHGRFLKTVIN